MKELDYVLDIGIGGGGPYIKKDNSRTIRVGLDNNECTLKVFDRKIMDIPLVVTDASGEYSLPFSKNTFKNIEILFPHDSLLYGLCYSDQLWQEFRRILTPLGSLTIISDVPRVDQLGIFYHDEPMIISSPHIQIAKVSRRNNFKVNLAELNLIQLKNYGTHFANFTLASQESWDPDRVFEINAVKVSHE